MRFFIGLMLLSLFSGGDQDPDPARLSARLELLRHGGVYVESTGDALEVYAGGWKVQRFPARIVEITRGKPAGVSQVDELVPLEPAPAAIIDSEQVAAEAGDTDADVSTLEQIIGVEKMPETFVAYFDDGSIWVVNPGDWVGFSRLWKKGELQLKMARHLFWQAVELEGFRISFVSLDPDSARRLYWILEDGMPVVQ